VAVKAQSASKDFWILDPWKDLALFVLSPLWIIPLLWLAKARFEINGFGSVLLAIGELGIICLVSSGHTPIPYSFSGFACGSFSPRYSCWVCVGSSLHCNCKA